MVTIEGTKFHWIPCHAAREVGADVVTTRNLRRSHPGAAVNRSIVLAQLDAATCTCKRTAVNGRSVVAQHRIAGPVRGVVGDRLSGRAATAELGCRVHGDGADVSCDPVRRSAERPLARGFVGHARPVAPTRRKNPIRVDAEVLFDLGHDGIGKQHVRIVRVGPSAPRGLRAVRVILLPVGGYEDRAVVGQREQVIILVAVHLVVVAIELVIGNDEFVRVGVVVVGRHVEDVLALHVGGRNRDVIAVVVLAARDSGCRFAAAARCYARRAACRRSAASAGAACSVRAAGRFASSGLSSCVGATRGRFACGRLPSAATRATRNRSATCCEKPARCCVATGGASASRCQTSASCCVATRSNGTASRGGASCERDRR